MASTRRAPWLKRRRRGMREPVSRVVRWALPTGSRTSTWRGICGCGREQVARRGFLDDYRRIVRQQVSARDKVLRGDPDPAHVIVAAVIALLDGRAGVARAFSFRFRRREWREGSDQHAGERLRLVLPGVGAGRHRDIRQPHATKRVAVLIAFRHLDYGGGKPGRGTQY